MFRFRFYRKLQLLSKVLILLKMSAKLRPSYYKRYFVKAHKRYLGAWS